LKRSTTVSAKAGAEWWQHILETLVCYRLIDPGGYTGGYTGSSLEQSAMGDLLVEQ